MQKSMSARRKFRDNIGKRRRSARGGFKMFIFSQNGHKHQNCHILESLGTPKHIEILENPRRRSVFAHGRRRFTTCEAWKKAYSAFIIHYEFVFIKWGSRIPRSHITTMNRRSLSTPSRTPYSAFVNLFKSCIGQLYSGL